VLILIVDGLDYSAAPDLVVAGACLALAYYGGTQSQVANAG